MRNQRSHWPKVMRTRRGDAGNQTRAFKSKDLGWCSYLNPRLTTGSLRHVHPSAFVSPVPSTRPGPKMAQGLLNKQTKGSMEGTGSPPHTVVHFSVTGNEQWYQQTLSSTWDIHNCWQHMMCSHSFNPHHLGGRYCYSPNVKEQENEAQKG